MKSILVGKHQNKKVYYVVDAIEGHPDCVIVDILGTKQLTDFWEFVYDHPNMHKISGTEFHNFLWDGNHSNSSGYWYSMFVAKTVPVFKQLLDSVYVNDDVLKRRPKMLEFENRAMNFSVAFNSQTMTKSMKNSWVDNPIRQINRKSREKKSPNA